MRDKREFDAILRSIDGKDPSEYAALTGDFDFTRFVLHNIKIPIGNSGPLEKLFVVHVPQIIAGFPPRLFEQPICRTALEDLLTRKVAEAIDRQAAAAPDGYARTGMSIARPGPEILPRSSVVVAHDYVEARILIRLPVRDGLIYARDAERIFFEDLPAVVHSALLFCYQDENEVAHFVNMMEDSDAIRQSLLKRGMIGFAANGSRIGPDLEIAVPEDKAVEVDTPNRGKIKGLGIPAGVTLIIGDPYSGRSELLSALAAGIYNHVPGDGRELVITTPDAVAVLSENRRAVQRVDLSAFLHERDGFDPKGFTSDAASAGEAQMASAMEALQVGAQVLLFDESFSDASFLATDTCLAELKAGAANRVIPLASRARKMADELRVSIVIGASACAAEFIPAADTVLLIDGGRVTDVTREAKAIDLTPPKPGPALPPLPPVAERSRWIMPSSIDPGAGKEDAVIAALDREHLQFGRSIIDLRGVPQLADACQTATIGLILYYAKLHYLDEHRTIAEVLDLIDQDLASEGLDALSRELRGDLARPRRYEIAAALNRLDSLRIARTNPKVARG